MITLVHKTETDNITNETTEKQTFNIIPLYEQWVNNCFQKLFIPNYKELCKSIDMNYCTNANTKNKQLEELSMYVDFTKGVNKNGDKGRGYLVNKINSTEYIPMEKNYKYYNDIRDMLLLYFSEGNMEENFFKKDLLTLIDICNPIYFENRERVREYAREVNIPYRTVEDFFNITDKKLSDIILGNLNKMYNEHFLYKFEKSFKVKVINEEEETIEYRIATDEEIIEIQYALYIATKEFNNIKFIKGFGNDREEKFMYNRDSFYQIPNLNMKEFTEYVMKILNKVYPNMIAYYPCYLIKFNHKVCNDYLSNHSLDENSNNLNEVFFNSLMRTFEKNSKKAINGNVPKNAKKYINSRKNKEQYEKLADTNVKKEIKKM